MSKSNTKSNTKTFHEKESQNLSPIQVSLDNADTVIEGLAHICGSNQKFCRGWAAPLLALFWIGDSTVSRTGCSNGRQPAKLRGV
jgi:hypothetical protein